jgi:purine-binding chemotaxis protein CheW
VQDSDGTSQIVAFSVGGVEYAFPIGSVKEIIRYAEPQPTSSTQPWMLGVINLRGSIVPIVDLGARLGREDIAIDDKTAKILVLEHGEFVVGAVVSSVDEVRTVEAEQVQDAPVGAASSFMDGVVTVDERLLMLLDAQALIDVQTGQAAA